MHLTSSAFQNGQSIPSKYTCDGENVSPQLAFADVPKNAKSLVLIMDDPDIPDFVKEKFGIEEFDHWILFNIDSRAVEIAEGQYLGTQGNNSRGESEYTGPCPPDREHRYFFKLYALDTMLNLKEGATKAEVEDALSGHIIVKTELIGKYKRRGM